MINIAPRIRLLLLHVSKITRIYFSSHGSSQIGLPFPPSFVVDCFCSCKAGVTIYKSIM